MEYVRTYYGMPWLKRGLRVVVGRAYGKPQKGVVTSADHRVWVRVDGERHAFNWHPKDVERCAPEDGQS